MAEEVSSDLRHLQHRLASDPSKISCRMREALEACSSMIEAEDIIPYDKAAAPVIKFLHCLLESSTSDLEERLVSIEELEEAIYEIYRFLCASDSRQVVIEALSLELPKLIIKFAPLSANCGEVAGKIIERLVSVCDPREMLSILCEALTSHKDAIEALGSSSHFMIGLSKVLLRIQKRHIEQIKVVLPVIFRVLNLASSQTEDEAQISLNDLFSAASSICLSIKEMCQKLEGERKGALRAILGLYVLNTIAFISRTLQSVESSLHVVARFSQFLPFCGLSYFGLLTGDLDKINKLCKDDEDDDFMTCFSSAACGATLSVIWGYISVDFEKVDGEQLDIAVCEIQQDRTNRWRAIGAIKNILNSINYSWIIKSHCIDVLLSIMDGAISELHSDGEMDFSSFAPNLFSSLMAIERFIIATSDPSVRKKAFVAFKMVVSDIPCSQRFDIMKALITNSDSPSMAAILIDLVKEEVLVDNHEGTARKEQNIKGVSKIWASNALDIVEMVLRPEGGPPFLPQHSETVLSALNLYRFIMIIEITGKTNHTGVLCADSLRKTYSEWLMPLRTLVLRILAEIEGGTDLAEGIGCALYPVQLVLYRCIELVEESLKHT